MGYNFSYLCDFSEVEWCKIYTVSSDNDGITQYHITPFHTGPILILTNYVNTMTADALAPAAMVLAMYNRQVFDFQLSTTWVLIQYNT